MEKDGKRKFTIDDINYIYKYIVINYSKIKNFRNLFLLLKNKIEREKFFKFITNSDSEYLKKSNLIYIGTDKRYNLETFGVMENNLIEIEFNDEFKNYMGILIGNGNLIKKVDDEIKAIFKSTFIFIFIYILVAISIVYLLGTQIVTFQGQLGDGMKNKIDFSYIISTYHNDFFIGFIVFVICFFIVYKKYLKHYYFFSFDFSKTYVLLKYKETLLSMFIKKVKMSKKGEYKVGYINLREEFNSIIKSLFPYLSESEILDMQLYIINDSTSPNIHNLVLKQEIIRDFIMLKQSQNSNYKVKNKFYEEIKQQNVTYKEVLEHDFVKDYKKLLSIKQTIMLALYFFNVFIVMYMIIPLVISTM